MVLELVFSLKDYLFFIYFFRIFSHNFSSELDPLEKWIELLSPFNRTRKGEDEGEEPDFHVLMLLKQAVCCHDFFT